MNESAEPQQFDQHCSCATQRDPYCSSSLAGTIGKVQSALQNMDPQAGCTACPVLVNATVAVYFTVPLPLNACLPGASGQPRCVIFVGWGDTSEDTRAQRDDTQLHRRSYAA
jgi:hypothetical protein